MWRVGHVKGPLELVPREHCSWSNRFDHPDPDHPPFYRTLYCAEQRVTCLYEILDPFSPNVKATEDLLKSYGEALISEIDLEFFLSKAIARGRIRIVSGDLVDLDDPGVRKWLESRNSELFSKHGIDRFDISAARSRQRPVTKGIGYFLYQEGAAGIVYGSNVDSQRCFALFEARAELELLAEPEPLVGFLDEIEPVLKKLNLRIAT